MTLCPRLAGFGLSFHVSMLAAPACQPRRAFLRKGAESCAALNAQFSRRQIQSNIRLGFYSGSLHQISAARCWKCLRLGFFLTAIERSIRSFFLAEGRRVLSNGQGTRSELIPDVEMIWIWAVCSEGSWVPLGLSPPTSLQSNND